MNRKTATSMLRRLTRSLISIGLERSRWTRKLLTRFVVSLPIWGSDTLRFMAISKPYALRLSVQYSTDHYKHLRMSLSEGGHRINNGAINRNIDRKSTRLNSSHLG